MATYPAPWSTPTALTLVYSNDWTPPASGPGIGFSLPAGTITGGEIVSVLLVTDDSADPISPTGNALINYGVWVNPNDGLHYLQVNLPTTGNQRAGDGLIALRIFRPT